MASNFDWSLYTSSEETIEPPSEPQNQPVQKAPITQGSQTSFDWNQYNPLPVQEAQETPDSFGKGVARTLLQIPQGAAELTGYGIGTSLWDLMGTGEALSALDELDESRIADLKQQFPNAPWENYKGIDREKYMQSLEEARSGVPTIANIASFVEKNTGLPLEPKTFLDKVFRIMGSGGKLTKGNLAQKTKGAVTTGVIKAGGEAAGIPEPISDILALGAGPQGAKVGVKAETKPSGLPTRRYESLTKPTKVTPRQAEKITETVEKDVRSLTNKLIKSESKTARAIEADPAFPEKINDLLTKVEDLAQDLPGKFPNESVKRLYRNKMKSGVKKGISPDEYELNKLKEMRKLYKSIPDGKNATSAQLLEQYRKNNKSIGELFEPGKSGAANRAKRDATLEYNETIADIFTNVHPDSEFNELFKFTNKRYSEMKDLSNIDDFFDKVFTKNINYKEANKFFNKDRVKKSFIDTLGKEGYNDMKQIMKDFISTERANRLIKSAESSGNKEVIKLAGKWMLSPIWGKAAASKEVFNFLRKSVLSNKKYRTTWKKSMEDFKKGKFTQAEEGFRKLEKYQDESESSNQKT